MRGALHVTRRIPRLVRAAQTSSARFCPASLEEFDVNFSSPLGSGAAGTVYYAQHRTTGREVALKAVSCVAPAGDLSREELCESIAFEQAAFETLDHAVVKNRHVVDCFSQFVGEGAEASELGMDLDREASASEMHYFVMELLDGGSLLDRVTKLKRAGAGCGEAEARHVAGEVADALSYLHGQGIVHRDVKPSNVLYAERTRAKDKPSASLKLIDFSVAGCVAEEGALRVKGKFGTEGFAAPEVLANEEYGPACDMYSLGRTLHKLLAPAAPEACTSVEAVPISADGKEALSALLAPNPAFRPTAEELLSNTWLARN